MKGTDNFKKVIQVHLEARAKEDPLFAVTFKKENKSIDDCITYILNTVQDSGCIGFSDEEIFGMAVHYYDEDSIEPGMPVNCKVVVNHAIEVTEEEKAQAKQAAIDKIVEEEKARLLKRDSKKKVIPASESIKVTEQASLF